MSLTTPSTLLTLQHSQTPYRGHWHFEQNSVGGLEAVHTTVHPQHQPGCVIERRAFSARTAANRFARHLLLHGWDIEHLQEEGAELLRVGAQP